MKSHKIRSIIGIILLLFSCYSCKKYLEEKSDKKLVTPQTLEDLQALLDDGIIMNNLSTPAIGEASADDYFMSDADFNGRDEFVKGLYSWKELPNIIYPNDWSNGYRRVYVANLCLEQVKKIDKTSQNEVKFNNVEGSALFFRAYYFLNLVWVYAQSYDSNNSKTDLGIVLKVETDFNSQSKRASVEECYNKVLADAKLAATLLVDHPLHVQRPSRAAAYGLLSRAYLSMQKIDSALKYADLALKIKSDLMNYNDASIVKPTALSPFLPFNTETVFFTTMVLNTGLNPSFARIDTSLYTSYASNDIRKKAFFNAEGKYWSFKGTYYNRRANFFTGIATDELLVTRAECYARLGNKEAAMDDLNKLLSKRYDASFVNLVAADAPAALNIIMVERRKQLLMRGLRWMDIKRLNKEGANIIIKRMIAGQLYTLQPKTNRYALPIPDDIITITGMPQNPK